jgi:hypothetical protein
LGSVLEQRASQWDASGGVSKKKKKKEIVITVKGGT